MFSVEVRDHIRIAHSFKGEVFGPAQALHGATFVVDAAVFSEELDGNGIVIDIGRAHEVLSAILAPLKFANLDENPLFEGQNTTTEFMAKYIWDKFAESARAGELGRPAEALARLRVTLSESHLARAWYEAAL